MMDDCQGDDNCFNEPFAVLQYKSLYLDMHGLILKTSIWLLAGSTRLYKILSLGQWLRKWYYARSSSPKPIEELSTRNNSKATKRQPLIESTPIQMRSSLGWTTTICVVAQQSENRTCWVRKTMQNGYPLGSNTTPWKVQQPPHTTRWHRGWRLVFRILRACILYIYTRAEGKTGVTSEPFWEGLVTWPESWEG